MNSGWYPDPERVNIAHIVQEVKLRWWDATTQQWTNYTFVKDTPNSEGVSETDDLTLERLTSFPPPTTPPPAEFNPNTPQGTTQSGQNLTPTNETLERNQYLREQITEQFLTASGYTSESQLSDAEREQLEDAIDKAQKMPAALSNMLLSVGSFVAEKSNGQSLADEVAEDFLGSKRRVAYVRFAKEMLTVAVFVIVWVFVIELNPSVVDNVELSTVRWDEWLFFAFFGVMLIFVIVRSVKKLRTGLKVAKAEEAGF